MAPHDFLGQTEIAAHLANLVFEQPAQGLHQLELEIFRQPTHVVVALDLHRNPLTGFGIDARAGALDHIGIQGALGQVIEGSKPLALLFKHPDEFGANQLALLLGIGHPIELVDEALPGIDVFDIDVKTLVEKLHQKLGLPFAHEALVNEHAGELIANGLVQQEGEGGGIDTTGEGQQHALLAHLGPHISHGLIDESGRGPVGFALTNVINEIAQHGHPTGGMDHLRVELHPIQPPLVIGHRRLGRVVRMGQAGKTCGQALHGITVAHPHGRTILDIGQQINGVVHKQGRLAVFSAACRHHRTAQLLHHQLHAVANTKDRNAQVPNPRITHRGPGLIHGARTATENDPLGLDGLEFFRRGGVTHHQRKHLGFAHAPGDQLGVLGTKIKDHNCRMATGLGGGIDGSY